MRTQSFGAFAPIDLDALQRDLESRECDLFEIEQHLKFLAGLARSAAGDGPGMVEMDELAATFNNIAGQIGTIACGLQSMTRDLMESGEVSVRTQR